MKEKNWRKERYKAFQTPFSHSSLSIF